jgi:hypothetical protein
MNFKKSIALAVLIFISYPALTYSQTEFYPESQGLEGTRKGDVSSYSNVNKFLSGLGMSSLCFGAAWLAYELNDDSEDGSTDAVRILLLLPAFSSAGIYYYGMFNGENGSYLSSMGYSYAGFAGTFLVFLFLGAAIEDNDSDTTRGELIFEYSFITITPLAAIIAGIYGYNKSRHGGAGAPGALFYSTGSDYAVSVPRIDIRKIRFGDTACERIAYCTVSTFCIQ